MDWKVLRKNALVIGTASLCSDLVMTGLHLIDRNGHIPPGFRKAANVAGVTGFNAGWVIAPLIRQPRLRRPWSRAARTLGAMLLAGGAFMGWSSTMDRGIIGVETPGSLVSRGMYGYMRHPTYFAITAASLGWSLLAGAPHAAAALPPLVAQAIAAGLFEEETQLKPLFGGEYDRYRNRVPFFPRSLTAFLCAAYAITLLGLDERFLGGETAGRSKNG